MLNDYKAIYKWVALLVLVIVAIVVTAKIQEWRYTKELANQSLKYEKQLAEINRVSNEKLTALQAKKERIEKNLAAAEAKYYKELQDEKFKNDQLIDDLANERRRLWINTTSSATTNSSGLPKPANASGMDNGATRAYINPRDAAAIIKITRRGDEAIRQLTACQEHFKEIAK